MKGEGSELRRSVRERRATTVKYNGFAVRPRHAICQRKGGPDPQERLLTRCVPTTEGDVQYAQTTSYTRSRCGPAGSTMRRSPTVIGIRLEGCAASTTPALVCPHPQCDRAALATRRRSASSPQLTRMHTCRMQVKVNNQYTLEEGERSVFDEEMGDVIQPNQRQYDKPLPKKVAAPRQAR